MQRPGKSKEEYRRMLRDGAIIAAGLGLACLATYICLRRLHRGAVMVCLWLVLTAVSLAVMFWLLPKLDRESDRESADELARTRRRVQEIQLQKRKEQLNALQSQINPHFLYNTLDTIRGMALEVEAVDVAQMVATLSAMFKYSMDYDDAIVTVGEELNHLRSYLQIQSIRFPNRFTFRTVYDCDYAHIRQVRIPKLVLQPIVENIFTHGFKAMTSGGQILVRCVADDQNFRITISDNGAGIRDDEVAAINRTFQQNIAEERADAAFENYGIALKNIDARVKMYFGEEYGLHIASTPDYGTDVTLLLPAVNGVMV